MFDSPTPKAYKANPNYSRFLQNFIKESVKIKAPKRTRVQSALNDTSRAMQTDRRSFTPSNRSQINTQVVINKMEKEFQKNDPKFKIAKYLQRPTKFTDEYTYNVLKEYSDAMNIVRSKTPSKGRAQTVQQWLVDQRHYYIERSGFTLQRINNFLDAQKRELKSVNSDLFHPPVKELNSDIQTVTQAQKSKITSPKTFLDTQNPLRNLIERYNELLMSDYNSFGDDMKRIVDTHILFNKIKQPYWKTIKPQEIQLRPDTSSIVHNIESVKNDLSHQLSIVKRQQIKSQKQSRSRAKSTDQGSILDPAKELQRFFDDETTLRYVMETIQKDEEKNKSLQKRLKGQRNKKKHFRRQPMSPGT